jgi:oligosaccharide repeat unit polymerase
VYPLGGRYPIVKNLIALQTFFLFFLFGLAGFCRVFKFETELMISFICWLIVLLSIWAFWSWWRVRRIWFDPYILFLFSAFLFNGGQAFLEVINFNSLGLLGNRFSLDTTLSALLAVALGLSAMHLGALLSIARCPTCQRGLGSIKKNHLEIKSLRTGGWLLLLVSLIPMLIITIDAVKVAWLGGYYSLYQQDNGVGIFATPRILAQFIIPSIFLFLAANGGSKKYLMLSCLLMFSYSLVFLLLGARYSAIAPLICYAWLWHQCWRPLPAKLLVPAGLILLGIVFPVIGYVRNVAIANRLSTDLFVSSFAASDIPIIDAISEMGGSLSTVAYTIDLVPLVRSFEYGIQYLYSITTIIPNIFGEVHPAIAYGIPTNWLIMTVAPLTAMKGGGIGYSFIAEAYLNFGFWGVPAILFVIGFLFVRLIVWATWSPNLGKLVMLAVFTSFFLVYPRSDSTAIIRSLCWYSFLPYVLSRFLITFSHPR